MKPSYGKIMFFLFLLSISFVGESCFKKGYGCPGEISVMKADSQGELSTKRGKSRLFSKKMRKRSKKHHR